MAASAARRSARLRARAIRAISNSSPSSTSSLQLQFEEAMANTRIENLLAKIRKGRGVGAADLARRVGVSRQTIYAIEAGTYVPNTEVALNLARALEVT